MGSPQVETLADGRVVLTAHNVFESTGEHVIDDQTLTFRTEEQIHDALKEARLVRRRVWGDWFGTPFDGTQPVMVFEATDPRVRVCVVTRRSSARRTSDLRARAAEAWCDAR